MIDFRYHLVSLVSVFLALAVGLALGAGPLKGTVGETLSSQVDQLRAEKDDLRIQLNTVQGAADNRDKFARAVSPALVRAQLGGETVLVVTLPGADSDAVKPLTDILQAAGARVTGRIDVKQAWTDAGRAADRETVLRSLTAVVQPATSPASATTTAPPGVSGSGSPGSGASGPASAGASPTPSRAVPSSVPTPSVTGATATGAALVPLLARAAVTTELGEPASQDAVSAKVLEGLRKGGLVGGDSSLRGRATAVVILAPPVEPASGGQPSASASAAGDPLAQWAALAVGLDARSDGVVVVGPASSATAGGLLASLRGQDGLAGTVSTVDSGSTPMGDVTTVLALREQYLGGAGDYGFVGEVKAPLPVLSEVNEP